MLISAPIESVFTPQEALLTLRGDARPFALTGRWAGGGAIVGSEPTRTAGDLENPFAPFTASIPAPSGDDAVGGGWFGYLAYGAGAAVERIPPPPPRPRPQPVSRFAYYDHLLRQDATGEWWFEGLNDGSNGARLQARLDRARSSMTGAPPRPMPFTCGDFTTAPGSSGYRRAVETCLSYIEAGDLYQANLALRLEAEFTGAGVDLFAAASAELAPAYGAYFDAGDAEIVSLSPELFLRRRGRHVLSAPIKGTSRRSADPARAREQSRELASSAKDRAENVMILDLIRNDLGRVCDYGSVRAAEATTPEAHPGLWHLVSEVEGDLYAGLTDSDLLRATFPPGSVTGAPKIKAQEVISTLESTGREAYTGAIGFASPIAGLEMNVAIRTFEVAAGEIWLGAGAGIVADSDPAAEYDEAIAKAEPLIHAAGSRIVTEPASPDRDPGLVPIRDPRPDPALGIIETMLVAEGAVVELEGHLDRLAASALALCGDVPDRSRLIKLIEENRPSAGRHRLRIDLGPGRAGRWELSARCSPVDPGTADVAVSLLPVTVPGGLGAHKWADRRLVDSVAAKGGGEALICDIDGAVLETGAGNLWCVEGDRLLTPPADGRILPGITRGALIEVARECGIEVAEGEIDIGRLEEADDAFITSSVRGVKDAVFGEEPVASPSGPIQRHLAEALASRWDPATAV